MCNFLSRSQFLIEKYTNSRHDQISSTSTIWKCFDLHQTYGLTIWLEFHGRGLRRGLCLAQASLWERRERWRWGRRRAWCWSWLRWNWHWAYWGTVTARCPSRPTAGRFRPAPQGSWRRAPHSQHCCLILWRIQQTARGHQSHSSVQLWFKISIFGRVYLKEMKLLLTCVLATDHVLNDRLGRKIIR